MQASIAPRLITRRRHCTTDAVKRAALREVALSFLRLGLLAFGGPAAHIAMMEDEFVRRRGWLTRAEFLDLVGAAGLIPGPSSTEVAIYIGHRRAGTAGLLLAGACFIAPAAVLTAGIAWAFVRYGQLPAVGGALAGIRAVVIAIVAQALLGLARSALRTPVLWLLAAAAAAATSALGATPLPVLLGTGALSLAIARLRRAGRTGGGAGAAGLAALPLGALAPSLAPAAAATSAAATGAVGLLPLFLVFAKIGGLVFGSGYVLLAFLRTELVQGTGWLTEAQLINAVAVGQFTPGPVFTTATFIGYLLAGLPGAAVATVGIFLPSFVLVAASGPLIPRLRGSPLAAAFLDGVNAASLALMAVVLVDLARVSLLDLPTVLLATAGAVLLVRFRVSSAYLVLGGGLFGLLLSALRASGAGPSG